jgi:energy-coupling factor transport system substrate-specific component
VNKERFIRLIKLSLLCILAVAGNFLINNLCVYYMKFPLFLDTVFNVAVTFAAGLIPGLITALLSYVALNSWEIGFYPFILCSIVEVLLVWRLMPVNREKKNAEQSALPATKAFSYIHIFARLMVLYIVCSLTISVLGGVIDYLHYTVLSNSKLSFSAEDTFKISLLRSGIPALAIDILSRIPVNIVDRFIVIFGGYFVSRLIVKLKK